MWSLAKRGEFANVCAFFKSNFVIISSVSALLIVGESEEYNDFAFLLLFLKEIIQNQKLFCERFCMELRPTGHKLLHS